ncbi:GatB/YqeY domain-containing protein [bacterium]|nr:GatB/YqeY domain-containing protein [bacterium]
MSIQPKLMDDLKAAMKAKDMVKVSTIRMLRAQLKDMQIAKGEELSPEEEMSALTNAAKKRKEAIDFYAKSSREDLLAKEKAELETISAYLPKQLSREEITSIVGKVIKDVGATSVADLGRVMGPAMQQLKGKADGKLVQEIVRTQLAS